MSQSPGFDAWSGHILSFLLLLIQEEQLSVATGRLGGLSLPSKSVVRLTDHPDMIIAVYHGRKTTTTTKIRCQTV